MQTDSSFLPSNFSDNGTGIGNALILAGVHPSILNQPLGGFAKPKGLVEVPRRYGTFIITKDVEGSYIGVTREAVGWKPPKRKFLKGEKVEGYLEATVAGASVRVSPRELIVGQFRIPSRFFEEENKASNTSIVADTSNHNYVFTKDFKALYNSLGKNAGMFGMPAPKPFKKGETIYATEQKDTTGNNRIITGDGVLGGYDVTDGVKPISKATETELKAMSGDAPSDEGKKGMFTPKNILIGLTIAGVLYFVFKPKK